MSIPTTLTRRTLIIAALAASAARGVHAQQKKPGIPLEVWKDPSCGCCKDWVEHMQANGFAVKVHESGNNAVRAQLGIDMKYGSCHTAVVGGYALEGHVPAREVHRLLKEKPQARGLAVPGMPIGSPGMDGPAYGGRRDAYDVVLLTRDGGAKVYQHYEGNKS
jgi:Predicted metal-binding protein